MQTRNEAAAHGFGEAITNGDRDAALALCHPEIEFLSMLGISGHSYFGHDGIREYFQDIESAWAEWSVDVERVAEGADGRVAIVMTMRARGQGSGLELTDRTAHIWTLRDGKLLSNQLYREPEEALRELGL
jgi:ketosteroid isomerase-like protein